MEPEQINNLLEKAKEGKMWAIKVLEKHNIPLEMDNEVFQEEEIDLDDDAPPIKQDKTQPSYKPVKKTRLFGFRVSESLFNKIKQAGGSEKVRYIIEQTLGK